MSHITYRGPSEEEGKTPKKKAGAEEPKPKILVRKAGTPRKKQYDPLEERVFEKTFYDDRRYTKHPDVTLYRSPEFHTPVEKRPGKRKKPSAFTKPATQSESDSSSES